MPKLYFRNLAGIKVDTTDKKAFIEGWRKEDWPLTLPWLLALAQPPKPQYCDVSITELSGEIQPSILARRYDVVADPLDQLYMAEGIGIHYALEKTGAEGCERQFVHEIEGLQVGGTVDLIQGSEIADNKNTSVWKIKRIITDGVEQAAPDYWEQLQYYAVLASMSKEKVESLALVLRARDWRQSEADKDSKYPQKAVTVRFSLAPFDDALSMLKYKVRIWKEAIEKPDAELPACTDINWGRPINGLPGRCARYCSVSDSCAQLKGVAACLP